MRLTRIARAAAIAAVFALGGSAAAAATVTSYLDFRGYGWLAHSYTFTDGALSVTATGHQLNSDGSFGTQEYIGQYSGGLGVTTDKYDQHFVDSNGTIDEVVKFAFNMAVKIEKVWFTYVDGADDFSFSVVSGGAVTDFFKHVDIWGWGVGSYSFAGTYVSDLFGIGAFGHGDEFKIKGMKVSYDVPAPVPLPAAGWLMLAGLGGLGALRRMRRGA